MRIKSVDILMYFFTMCRMKRDSDSTSKSAPLNKSAIEEKESFGELGQVALDLMRCSVCKDRFKDTTITRCFHLFCKECIDENLRNRHRKCPACGEKFGQDDVRKVYFNSV